MTQEEKANAAIYHIIREGSLADILEEGYIKSADRAPMSANTKIWNDSFLSKRARTHIPLPTKLSLSGFVPFFGTPKPPALYNVITGYGADHQLRNSDILLLKTSVQRLADHLVPLVFADRQPLSANVTFRAGCLGIDLFDWLAVQSGDFSSKDDTERKTKVGAEVLAFREVPIGAIAEIICFDGEDDIRSIIEAAKLFDPPTLRCSRSHFFSRGA